MRWLPAAQPPASTTNPIERQLTDPANPHSFKVRVLYLAQIIISPYDAMYANGAFNLSKKTMTNIDNKNIESIAQSMVDDAQHYVNSVSAMANSHDLEAVEDIVSSSGIKLVARGTAIDEGLREKLFRHRLSGATLEKSLSIAGGVTSDSLAIDISRLIEQDHWFKQLATKSGDEGAMRHGVSRMVLPPEILFRLTVAREQRPELYRHSLSVTIISHYLALRLNLKQTQVENVIIAALCHDFGELYTDPAILDPGHRITDEERRFIYVHPITGWLIVRDIEGINPEIAKAIIQHQERLDGSGYPNGIKGDLIGTSGRILGAADICASIVARFKDHRRLSTLLRLNGTKYDRKIVNLLLEAIHTGTASSAQYSEEDSRKRLADFAQLISGWSLLRTKEETATTELVVFLTDRMYNLRTVVLAAGFDPDSLETALNLASEDSIIATELAAVIDELKFQLADLEHEIDRRAPAWLDKLNPITCVALNDWRRQLRDCNRL